jgi:hypothetical protein
MNESKTDTDFSQSTISDFGTETFTLNIPERSQWRVWLMGDHDSGQHGAIVYNPVKGQEPNWFHRKMQELCFGFQWRKK